jgi:hypothetical protein
MSTGGIAWMFAALCLGQGLIVVWDPRLFCRRFIGGSLVGTTLSLCLWLTGMRIMTAVLISIGLALLILYWRFPRYHKVSLICAASFAVFYFIVLKTMFLIFPEFPLMWSSHNLSGLVLLHVPAEEILWALCFGAAWPHFVAYVFDARTN